MAFPGAITPGSFYDAQPHLDLTSVALTLVWGLKFICTSGFLLLLLFFVCFVGWFGLGFFGDGFESKLEDI